MSKPFESWIQKQLEEVGSAEKLMEDLGEALNEEMIVQIKAMARDEW